MAKARKKERRAKSPALGALLRARVDKLWARFEKTGSMNDYLAYDDALNAARSQGLRLDPPGAKGRR